jgi:glycerate 2-kinase
LSSRALRRDIRRTLDKAILAADPQNIIKQKVKLHGHTLLVAGSLRLDLDSYRRIFVIGGGKASASMALAIEHLLREKITDGLINYPDYLTPKKLRKIKLNAASHPIPNKNGVLGVQKMLKLAENVTRKDLFICLISGGGSSLMPLPIGDLTLEDKQKTTTLLLKCGGDIHEVNTVRKHMSGVKGGRLAERLAPATILSLIISDVVGDDLDSIASGPTVPDTSSREDALSILKRRNIWKKIPTNVQNVLLSKKNETPKPGSKIFENVFNVLVGSNRQSCLAASNELKHLGYRPLILTTRLKGDASQSGSFLASILREIRSNGVTLKPPAAIIAGGETTVKVTGNGIGGRNQELALSAAIELDGLKGVALASIDTDGVDGFTNAAGAIIDGATIRRGKKRNLEAKNYLMRNDSYNFLKKTGDLIISGPTGTNVNDIMIGAAI